MVITPAFPSSSTLQPPEYCLTAGARALHLCLGALIQETSTSATPELPVPPTLVFRVVPRVMSHFLSPSNLPYHPSATKGQQDPFDPYPVWPGSPRSPGFTSKVLLEAPAGLPSLLWRLLPTTELSRYNAAKRGATIITGTANRKALSCLSGQPGLPGTCEAQQGEEKRKRAGAARGKPRL